MRSAACPTSLRRPTVAFSFSLGIAFSKIAFSETFTFPFSEALVELEVLVELALALRFAFALSWALAREMSFLATGITTCSKSV